MIHVSMMHICIYTYEACMRWYFSVTDGLGEMPIAGQQDKRGNLLLWYEFRHATLKYSFIVPRHVQHRKLENLRYTQLDLCTILTIDMLNVHLTT